MPDNNSMKNTVYYSPWRNTYWFARNLLNANKYGAVGKDNKLLQNIITETKEILSQPLNDSDKLTVCLKITADKILASAKPNSKARILRENFTAFLNKEIQTLQDYVVFLVTIEYIVMPTNYAISNIPSDDIEFCRTTAENILKSLGRTHVDAVLSTWDNMGVYGCLNVERCEIIREFTKLRANLQALAYPRNEIEDNTILTAFVQEFERRAGQKRKSRAGNSLEDVVTFFI